MCWTNDPVKILGIWFTPNKELMYDLNFTSKQSKIRNVLDRWEHRNLDLMTKVTTGRARLIRSHSSARFCFELSGNSN